MTFALRLRLGFELGKTEVSYLDTHLRIRLTQNEIGR